MFQWPSHGSNVRRTLCDSEMIRGSSREYVWWPAVHRDAAPDQTANCNIDAITKFHVRGHHISSSLLWNTSNNGSTLRVRKKQDTWRFVICKCRPIYKILSPEDLSGNMLSKLPHHLQCAAAIPCETWRYNAKPLRHWTVGLYTIVSISLPVICKLIFNCFTSVTPPKDTWEIIYLHQWLQKEILCCECLRLKHTNVMSLCPNRTILHFVDPDIKITREYFCPIDCYSSSVKCLEIFFG